ncbi:DUF6300 family protein [Streptomyces sp. NPDC087532]|uniref:DUF6300 family protein n=1 Tax=Streptomyces sp. NPDC087532 TaxID=3365795 RepID=UPI00381B27AE
MRDEDGGIALRLADPPDCAGCGGPGLLLARFTHAWNDGRPGTGQPASHLQPVSANTSTCKVLTYAGHAKEVHSIREAVLCPACDRGEQAADRLLAFLVLHEALTASELETFHVLVTAWVAVARDRQADQHQLDDEFQRWRNGEL